MGNGKSLSSYIAAAENACAYVRKMLPSGANNSVSQKLFRQIPVYGWIKTQSDIATARDSYDLALQNGSLKEGDWKSYIELMARTGIRIKAGNCGEQASVAFTYLKDQGIRSIEYMEYTDRNHAFVILNRRGDTNIANFAEWSENAIVCDPWRDAVGLAGMLPVWYHSTKVVSRYRLD
jgi:hypothetical protein